jgi:hypothetical protein
MVTSIVATVFFKLRSTSKVGMESLNVSKITKNKMTATSELELTVIVIAQSPEPQLIATLTRREVCKLNWHKE